MGFSQGDPSRHPRNGGTTICGMDVGQAERDLSPPRYLVDPPSS